MSELDYTQKTCRKCGEEKHITEFYPHSTGKDGYRNDCKSCHLAQMKESADPIRRKEYVRKYYEQNSEHIKAKTARWRKENSERYKKTLREYSSEKRMKDPELAKRRARGYALKRKYGISLTQYEELLEKQNHSCAICERHKDEFSTSLAVDHDHATGRIRGLLCTNCNYRLVAKHRDGELLRRIADYIEQGTEWFIPEKKKKKRGKRKDMKIDQDTSD